MGMSWGGMGCAPGPEVWPPLASCACAEVAANAMRPAPASRRNLGFKIMCILSLILSLFLQTLVLCLWRACCIACSECLRSEEHTSELQSLMRISYAVFCLKTKNIPLFIR